MTDTALVQMDEFIWEDMGRPAEAAESAPLPIPQEVVEEGEAQFDETKLPRIVVLSDDATEPDDEWRRQFISALHDVDRETGPLTQLPAAPPPRTHIEDLHRPPPRSLSPIRPARMGTPAPVERAPRHRIGRLLLGISAAVGLLSAALPRATNIPEAAVTSDSAAIVLASANKQPVAESDLRPVMFNAPVLVREGTAPKPERAVRALPVIETVRTVPVLLRREAAVSEAPSTPAINLPVVEAPPAADPTPTPAAVPPPPAATSAPLDRDGLAALTAQPPAAPPSTVPPLPRAKASQAPSAPVAAAPPEPKKTSRTATQPTPKRKPQISSSYERSAPKASRESRKRKTQTSKKATARAEGKQWDTRRQGLRTSHSTNEVKEVEPSTMVKLLKSLNPFASKGESQDRPKKNIFE